MRRMTYLPTLFFLLVGKRTSRIGHLGGRRRRREQREESAKKKNIYIYIGETFLHRFFYQLCLVKFNIKREKTYYVVSIE